MFSLAKFQVVPSFELCGLPVSSRDLLIGTKASNARMRKERSSRSPAAAFNIKGHSPAPEGETLNIDATQYIDLIPKFMDMSGEEAVWSKRERTIIGVRRASAHRRRYDAQPKKHGHVRS